MVSAVNLADQGFKVNLVEKESELGGNLRYVHYLLSGNDPQEKLREIIERVTNHDNIKLWLNAKVEDINGFVGNFNTVISQGGENSEIEHGAVIVALGAKEYTPTEYLYGKDEKVITQRQLEKSLASDTFSAKSVVMIQCVGSREGERNYCSRLCCSQAVKNAMQIKDRSPKTDVFILYRDMRTYGFREKYYTQAREKGIHFVRYEVNDKPKVTSDNGKLTVEVNDLLLGGTLEINPDLLVLAPAVIPHDDVENIAKMLKVPLTSEKFFLEAHMKLRPVDFSVDGVFLAGLAHFPKSIEETIAQAEATAARAAIIISKKEYTPEAVVANVDEDVCSECGICVSICAYDAPELIDVKGATVSRVNTALCKGCGACGMACPSGAIQQYGFKAKQLMEMVNAALV